MLDIERGGSLVPDDPFRVFFKHATGIQQGPYPYQERLAAAPIESRLIHVPTGCGKTAAVILARIWRRRPEVDRNNTLRRLAACPARPCEADAEWAGEWI
jgi:hypothetical protein